MKKNILSLVAFMAFSVSAFANTNTEIKKNESNSILLFIELNCAAIKYNTYWTWKNAGASHELAIGKANEAKIACDEENKKSVSTECSD